MKNQWLLINQLDKQLKEWQLINAHYHRPRVGWVKTIRMALSMTAEQLGKRLGLTRSRINQLENAEIHEAVSLRSLREAANAMECDLVYAIVPKPGTSLETIIKRRSEEIAARRVGRVAHTMSLEDQSLRRDILENQKEEVAKQLREHLNKKFWSLLENELLSSVQARKNRRNSKKKSKKIPSHRKKKK